MSRTQVIHAEQYGIACVSVEDYNRINPDVLINECIEAGAVWDRDPDGREYCCQLREENGPELWTEEALRRGVGKELINDL